MKPFMNYEQQIEKLKEKNLIISNPDFARNMLIKYSYYSLIGGYKRLFKNPITKNYIDGVTFEEIVAFYHFDEDLRALFLKYILPIERQLKSTLSYYFCEKYGEKQSAYLDANNFNNVPKNRNGIARLIAVLAGASGSPSNYAYINHHNLVYGNVPLWVLMNALTFGNVSAMYQYSLQTIQAQVCKHFEYLNIKQFHQMITVVAKCRNVCAHAERLYSFKTTDDISNTVLHKKLNIPSKGGQYTQGKRDLFAVVIALRYLLDNKDFLSFKKSLVLLLNKVEKSCTHLPKDKLMQDMGFPDNWKEITRYKLK